MEEIQNDYTRDSEMGMGFRLISQYESMNEEHRSAGTEGKQDLTGVKKREIRVEKKIDD